MIVVGLTGSLASGKSEAARIFHKLGAQVFDADASARKLLQKGTPAYRAAVKLFGPSCVAPGGQLDRARIAARVFSSRAELKKLNTLLHPMVILDCLKVIEKFRKRKGRSGGRGMLVLDVPLLFESRMEKLADAVVVVRSTPSAVRRRLAARGMTPQLARQILKSQWPVEKKARLADFVIDNDGTRRKLERQVRELYAIFSAHKGGR